MSHCHKSSETNKGGATLLALSTVWVCACPPELHSSFLRYTKALRPHLKFQGCCFRLLDVLDWSQTCCLASNVIVMAFVISISRWVLKHRVLNGDISVNLGLKTHPINSSFCLLLTVLFVCHYHQEGEGWEVTRMTCSSPVLTWNYRLKQVVKSLKVRCSSSKEKKSIYH